jgi:DNA-nicking Smr family endonuclease
MRKPAPPAPPAETEEKDDAALFRDAIGPVRPLAPVAEPVARRRPAPRPRQREADEDAALRQMRDEPFRVEAGDLLQYRRPEVAPRVLKRLRRGQYAIQDEIDLHGLTAGQAEGLLRSFLQQARLRGCSCVRLVHGKGHRSHEGGGPVLKPLVERLLGQRRDVLAFSSAPPTLGGAGAVLVLLARRRPGETAPAGTGTDSDGQ